ncbi:MAG TPA: hypothetical protein VFI43_10055, partial [Nitrosospira sp.]|nr:hypothetical protein [Nitrosospira sp.]
DDWIFGGRRSDVLVGGRGNDTVFGDNGNDRVNGGNGNDHLYGGDGADHLYGDAGNDYLNGGKGGDWLYGGAGNDTFDYNALSDSPGFEETSPVIVRDSIVGFNGDGAALGDRIDLSSIDANLDVDGNQAFTPAQLSYSNGIFSANVIGFGIPGSLDLQIHLVGNPPLDIVGATNDIIL